MRVTLSPPIFKHSAASDPLTQIVGLLQPSICDSRLIECNGNFKILCSGNSSEILFCVILTGGCNMLMHNDRLMSVEAGDFILLPAYQNLEIESVNPSAEATPQNELIQISHEHFQIGEQLGFADLRIRLGHCKFESADSELSAILLPQVVHIKNTARLISLIEIIDEESHEKRLAQQFVFESLLKVLMVEALRAAQDKAFAPGIARGMADPHIANVLFKIHDSPAHPWTMPELATYSDLSRSAFVAKFNRTVGCAPMRYVLMWRMAIAKQMLLAGTVSQQLIAESVGYGSQSAFSIAFTRHYGVSPSHYAQRLQSV